MVVFEFGWNKCFNRRQRNVKLPRYSNVEDNSAVRAMHCSMVHHHKSILSTAQQRDGVERIIASAPQPHSPNKTPSIPCRHLIMRTKTFSSLVANCHANNSPDSGGVVGHKCYPGSRLSSSTCVGILALKDGHFHKLIDLNKGLRREWR